ncbi:hypothetical protein BU26DRAFT_557677 [Trematosphaeria pertusa]|uniref:Uncharacterized protein n=1 Tax=Trematosphaeria pertusa TaxID=390896 RepID=A0A6A6J400_9PLEO|nr:uncharacterized protein BU26DRAFT_557677 [Trematosphaeria pertusa]KAF2256203.1 hypothetical protein BU26DRAFT_557677 [Trematosphaeria pertusa]
MKEAESSKLQQISTSVWVPIPQCSSWYVGRDDLERIVLSMLRLPWTPFSYLIWKSNNGFWHSLLRESTGLLDHLPLLTARFDTVLERKLGTWKDWNRFEPGKTDFLAELTASLEDSLFEYPSLTRLSIGVLYITNVDFCAQINALLDTQSRTFINLVAKFDTKSGKIEWERDSTRYEFSFQSPVLEEGAQEIGEEVVGDDVVELKSTDLIAMALWAAVRCALWRCSPSSKPLLRFIKSMDSVAHVK